MKLFLPLENQANNTFDLVSNEKGVISVYDMLGKLLQTIEKTDEHALIDLSTNSEGIYLLLLKITIRKKMLSK